MHETTQSGLLTVVEYINAHKVKIKFNNTGFEKSVSAAAIRTGRIQDPLAKTNCGVGFNGVGIYTQSNSKGAGDSWRSMINRCYSETYLSRKPTYRECKVSVEWHNFQNYAEWYEDNYPNDGERIHLDKDLLVVGNKVYSSNTCVFVPQWLNSFMSGSMAIRGEHPIGVSFSKIHKKFESYCNYMGKRKHLGLFSNATDAHAEWVKCKLELAKKRKNEMDLIDERIYPNVVQIISTSH